MVYFQDLHQKQTTILKKFKLNDIQAFKSIGEKKLVAGQEDLIFNILLNLKNK